MLIISINSRGEKASLFPCLVRRLIQASKVISIALYPKPIVVGGGVLARIEGNRHMTSLITDHHENRHAFQGLGENVISEVIYF